MSEQTDTPLCDECPFCGARKDAWWKPTDMHYVCGFRKWQSYRGSWHQERSLGCHQNGEANAIEKIDDLERQLTAAEGIARALREQLEAFKSDVCDLDITPRVDAATKKSKKALAAYKATQEGKAD